MSEKSQKSKCECKHDRLYASCEANVCRCRKHSEFAVKDSPATFGALTSIPPQPEKAKYINEVVLSLSKKKISQIEISFLYSIPTLTKLSIKKCEEILDFIYDKIDE